MKQILFLSLSFCLLVVISKGQQNTESLKMDFITKFPSVIDGCSGVYTYDTTSTKKKKYIIVTDLQELGFIKIHGKEIKLNITDKKDLSSTSFRTTFKGDGYTVILTTNTVKQIDELSIENGTLEITKGSLKMVLTIHGESGC